MAINFPNTPATNDTFTSPTGLEYIYDGTKWRSFKPSEPVVGAFNANSAISLTAGGTNQNIVLTPSGTGAVTTPASVGIGTTAPTHSLHINQTVSAQKTSISRLNGNYTVGNLSHGIGFSINANSVSSGVYVTESGGAGASLTFTTSPSYSTPTNVERMRIDASGNVGIGNTAPTDKLSVNGNIVSTSLTTPSITNPGILALSTTGVNAMTFSVNSTEMFRLNATTSTFNIGASFAPGVAIPNALATTGVAPRFNVQGTTNGTGAASVSYWANNTGGSSFILNKSRGGSIGTAGLVSNGDMIGGIGWNGDDGVIFQQAAAIRVDVDGTAAANSMPGRLVFSTTASGAAVATERMRITSSGAVGIGNTSPSRTLDIAGALATIGIVNTNAGTGGAISVEAPNAGVAQIDVVGANVLRLNTNAVERLRVNSTANSISIGTATTYAHATTTSAIDLGIAGGFMFDSASNGMNVVANGYYN